MFGINWRWTATTKRLASSFMAAVLIWGLAGCVSPMTEFPKISTEEPSAPVPARTISEVSPPQTIQELRQTLEIYQPQVKILSPRPGSVLEDNTVTVQFQVQDLPIYKDVNLGLGPHLHVFLDNQPYTAVYDANEPLVLTDLEPGTHTLRAFASRPWHESFKNEGAYAQTTFHLFTKTPNNNPDPALPLLTYSRPQSSYGAEPIMLDFYLTNAPLHQVALENPEDAIVDWRIRVTINGESFVTDQWQPLYLTGFKPGQNWVQLEFLDEEGNPLKNVFNNTVRLITYEPNGEDTLSKLVRGELTAAEAGSIVDPNYIAQPPVVEPIEAPTATPTPVPEPSAEPASTPEPEVTPTDGTVPTVEGTPATPVPTVEGTPKTEEITPEGGTPETKPTAAEVVPPSAEPAAQEAVTPKSEATTPEDVTSVVKPTPTVEATPEAKSVPTLEVTPIAQPAPEAKPVTELGPPTATVKVEVVKSGKPETTDSPGAIATWQEKATNFLDTVKNSELFSRFWPPSPIVPTPSESPKVPELPPVT